MLWQASRVEADQIAALEARGSFVIVARRKVENPLRMRDPLESAPESGCLGAASLRASRHEVRCGRYSYLGKIVRLFISSPPRGSRLGGVSVEGEARAAAERSGIGGETDVDLDRRRARRPGGARGRGRRSRCGRARSGPSGVSPGSSPTFAKRFSSSTGRATLADRVADEQEDRRVAGARAGVGHRGLDDDARRGR